MHLRMHEQFKQLKKGENNMKDFIKDLVGGILIAGGYGAIMLFFISFA